MARIRVEQAHTLSIDGVKVGLESFEADIAKFGMKLAWQGSKAQLKGVGASGDVTVESDRVIVTVKLGMLAKAAGVRADRLQGSISRRLAAAFGSQTET